MEQTEIDDTITALQNRVLENVMAQVIQVVDQQIVPLKWAPQEPQQPTADLDTSRRSIQIPVQNQLRVPVSPRSENPTAESTSQLERVLDQGNMSEQQQIAQIQVIKPIAHRDNPMYLQEDTAGTPMVDELPTPEGDPPPPEIVQESILTEPLQRTIPQGLQPDLASVFVNADEMIAAYENKPRVFPTRPCHLAIQQGKMLQMMWNHTRNQAARVDSIEQILANQYQILRSGIVKKPSYRSSQTHV
eukprot:2644177-Amphidinium_carterae.1